MLQKNTKQLAADAKFFESYSRYDDEMNRYETWEESVERVMQMHMKKYADKMTPELLKLINYTKEKYNQKLVLGAQRALQFGGDQLLKHEFKMYNCTSGHLDRIDFFGEYMYLLLCGSGVGFSVQTQHIEKLPVLIKRNNKVIQFVIPDSIEGWAESIDILFNSFTTGGKFPQYSGKKVYFDFSKIRSKGSLISGGFKAPGAEPLRRCLAVCEETLTRISYGDGVIKPIDAYDLAMHIADAVISGGVRRAATIALFSPTDTEMLMAKTGNWFMDNPQRARSNNSVILQRDETSLESLQDMTKFIKQFGEPGFILTDNKEFTYNPCVEIGMLPVTEDGESGFQACNLTEINGSMCDNKEKFFEACKAAAIIGTLQAGYTNFKYVSDATRKIIEREALIGVSVTGWMNNPDVLFDKDVMRKGATIVKKWNAVVADMLNINHAARTTCVKPAGNTSVLLQTANGIHGEHSPRYFRHIQMDKTNEVAKAISSTFPSMIENSVWSTSNATYCVAFPFVANKNSVFKNNLIGVKQLEYVKLVQQNWVEYGTNLELCTDARLRHNVSNTITVDDWDSVIEYVFENKKWFAGVSFIAMTGDKDYAQAPNASVLDENEIVNKYGAPALFASGLICQGLDTFNNDLWLALATAMGNGLSIDNEAHENVSKQNFVKRLLKYSDRHFDGNLTECVNCLKDVYYLHKWQKIQQNIDVDSMEWTSMLTTRKLTDIDTMGAVACNGVQGCEI